MTAAARRIRIRQTPERAARRRPRRGPAQGAAQIAAQIAAPISGPQPTSDPGSARDGLQGRVPPAIGLVVAPPRTEDDAAHPGDRPPSLEQLRAAAETAPRPLPRRAELEALFGADLSGIGLVGGAAAEEALDALGAEAATVEGRILARDDAPLPVLAHEVAHALQARGEGVRALAPPEGAAEREAREAERVAARLEAAGGRPTDGGAVSAEAALAPGEAALRRADAAETLDVAPSAQAADEFDAGLSEETPEEGAQAGPAGGTQAEADRTQTADAQAGEAQAEGTRAGEDQAQGTEGGSAFGPVDLGEDIPENPTPTFEPAPMPELDIDAEAAAAAEAAAEEKIAGAEDADALMEAFRDAPPSVKARKHDQLDVEAARLSREEQATFDAELPDFDAKMSGTDDLPESAPVLTPEAKAAALETPPDLPVAEAEVDPTPDPGKAEVNNAVLEFLRNVFGFGGAEDLGRTFGKVATSDRDVDTDAGERPKVPLEGATDPQQVEDQGKTAREDAEAKRSEAAKAVLEGPGPERVGLKELHEEHRLEPRAAPEIAATKGGGEGATEFRDKKLDPEVVALFDQDHGPAMAESLDAAKSEMKTAVDDRDTGRDAEVTRAEEKRDELNREADEGQRAEVKKGRDAIQTARQTAVDDQDARRRDLDDQVERDRKTTDDEIDAKVLETEKDADDKFDKAEEDAEAEVDKGETKAEEEKKRQERESKNKSWWERATDWVAEQFDKLTKFINDVFDAVRQLVKDIIDKVKEAVVKLIDAAANAIKSAIRGFGELLKKGVNALLSEHFPGIAKALNGAIDSGVELAEKAVDVVADGLKKGITALLDALGKALDAILALYQAAVNAALALAKAAITGDWAAVAKMILEPILRALGIDPKEFYALIGKAVEALSDIIDDPIGFLKNLVDAVLLGFRKFGENILEHLQKGIIGWLTGALAGALTLPAKFDLMGILDLGRQILGLTVEMIRKVAVRVLGEKAVEKIEFFLGYAVELISGGWSALWEKIKEDLGNLRDMVFDGIKEFVLTRIILAAVTWLASLFNPVGALIKLVMTIWNFLMFLKDQLARIIQVVKTVIGFMYDIAKGVIEPAALGIEKVLGNLVPIVLDLLARLLGLGDVGGRVRKILAKIQQRIEDALVKLIRKVVARFTGKGGAKGKDAKDAKAKGAAPGEILKPVPVRGGGESHTLYIEDQGKTVVPMIRTTPMTVASWLDARLGAPFEERAQAMGWTGDEKARKKAELAALVEAAKAEEGLLDKDAEAADDLLDAAKAGAAKTGGAKAGAAAPASPQIGKAAAAVADQAQDAKRAIEKVLDFLGVAAGGDLSAAFATEIGKMRPTVAAHFTRHVLPKLNARVYGGLDWARFAEMLASDAAAPMSWQVPAGATGAARKYTDGAFDRAVRKRAEEIAAQNERPNAETFVNDDAKLNKLFGDYLAAQVNTPAGRLKLTRRLLGSKNATLTLWVKDIEPELTSAVLKMTEPTGAPKPDFEIKAKIKGSNFVNLFEDAAGARKTVFVYYKSQKEDGSPEGPGVPKPLPWFLQPANGSPRSGPNRGHVSNAIRAAKPGMHEWVPASIGYAAINKTAGRFESDGSLAAASGVANFVEFQNTVRTPTTDLVFAPESFPEVKNAKLPYVSRKHHESKKSYADLTAKEKAAFYPPSGPAFGAPVPALQAHAGALRARAVKSGALDWTFAQQASPRWHINLQKRIADEVAGGVALKDMTEVRDAILTFYDETIWSGSPDLPRIDFDVYELSGGGGEKTYGGVKAHAKSKYQNNRSTLVAAMKKVLES